MVRKRKKVWVDTKELEELFARILKKERVDEEAKELREEFEKKFRKMISGSMR
jgi:BMFP domain-containing protein YqiC|tara:strand:+ start:271 stop:429 length:159 start_codon:yes stop_codon:yes gene_type:complete